MSNYKAWLIVAAVLSLLVPRVSSAQTTKPGGDAPGPPPMPLRRTDGTAVALEAAKNQIHATDEEWKVIGPKLRKVIGLRRAAQAGLNSGESPVGSPWAGFFGQPGGPGGFPRGGGFPGNDSFKGPGGPGAFGHGRPGPDGFGPPPDRQPAGDEPSPSHPTTAPGADSPDRERAKDAATNRPLPGAETGRGPADPGPAGAGPAGGDFPRPPGGPPPPGMFDQHNQAVVSAMANLQAAVADKASTPSGIAEKIAVVRAARHKARTDLEAAEKDLSELLTPEQQGVLISLGYLE